MHGWTIALSVQSPLIHGRGFPAAPCMITAPMQQHRRHPAATTSLNAVTNARLSCHREALLRVTTHMMERQLQLQPQAVAFAATYRMPSHEHRAASLCLSSAEPSQGPGPTRGPQPPRQPSACSAKACQRAHPSQAAAPQVQQAASRPPTAVKRPFIPPSPHLAPAGRHHIHCSPPCP
jgi:hypothetical protein